MKKRIIVLGLCVILSSQIFTGCSSNSKSTNEKTISSQQTKVNKEVTFTDDLGDKITVSNPKRVVSLIGSFTDMWHLAGGEVVGASHDSWTSFDLGLSNDVIDVGNLVNPDVEKIIAAKPDFVLASANLNSDLKLKETLTKAGIKTAYFNVSSFEDYLKMLNICTDITGRKELFKKYGTDVKAQIDTALKMVDGSKPKVLFLRASSDGVKAKGSKGNVGTEILKSLGCTNIADSDKTMLDNLSMEAIIKDDPDFIFVTAVGENQEKSMSVIDKMLITNPAWKSLSAVKKGNYYVLDKNLYNTKPNARWGEAYKHLAEILYGRN